MGQVTGSQNSNSKGGPKFGGLTIKELSGANLDKTSLT